ncbi:MAG: methyltransferase domain-containing protein [Planctomycetes bacterium]|nr:methyltransferase domain-containing protein [Planctomycetota bacterium]
MGTPERLAQHLFSERAASYTTSPTHADPKILARVVELAAPRPVERAIDIATGTGHTALALAPNVASVIGTDLTTRMLEEARRLRDARLLRNARFLRADAHRIPFPDRSFDIVTCRRAAHHFSNIDRALGEMKRLLQPGGRLVIDDRSGPEDDAIDEIMNRLDRWHDPSHVRQYRPSEWRRMLDRAGLSAEVVEPYLQHRPVTSLTDGAAAEDVQHIRETLDRLPPVQREFFDLREVDGGLHLNHWYVLILARFQ